MLSSLFPSKKVFSVSNNAPVNHQTELLLNETTPLFSTNVRSAQSKKKTHELFSYFDNTLLSSTQKEATYNARQQILQSAEEILLIQQKKAHTINCFIISKNLTFDNLFRDIANIIVDIAQASTKLYKYLDENTNPMLIYKLTSSITSAVNLLGNLNQLQKIYFLKYEKKFNNCRIMEKGDCIPSGFAKEILESLERNSCNNEFLTESIVLDLYSQDITKKEFDSIKSKIKQPIEIKLKELLEILKEFPIIFKALEKKPLFVLETTQEINYFDHYKEIINKLITIKNDLSRESNQIIDKLVPYKHAVNIIICSFVILSILSTILQTYRIFNPGEISDSDTRVKIAFILGSLLSSVFAGGMGIAWNNGVEVKPYIRNNILTQLNSILTNLEKIHELTQSTCNKQL